MATTDLFARITEPMEFVLPICPSTNNLYFNVSPEMRAAALKRGTRLPGRLPSSQYKSWREDCLWRIHVALRSMPRRRIESPWYDVLIRVGIKARLDADAIKAVPDLFVKAMITPDDRKMWAITSRRSIGQEAAMMRVYISERWAEE